MKLAFGTTFQTVEIPTEHLIGVLEPNRVTVEQKGAPLVAKALQNPIGAPRLAKIVKRGERVAIITSDMTRPVPSYKILPAVLEELFAAGVAPEDVTVVFALGVHRRQTAAERKALVGDVYHRVRCVDGDPEDCIPLGTTRFGTPVEITHVVAQADRRIGIGNIEYHYFAGYSGGAKAIMPGVSNRAAIQSNHSRMVLPAAAAGRLEDNPIRMDIEDALSCCPLDYIVNVVLDEQKEIIHAVAGHAVLAHRQGCKFLDTLYRKEIPARADIVIASQGGAPKDLNLYQTQKALDNAKYAVKKGGIIILVGSCREGLGEEAFEAWMTSAKAPEEMVRRIQETFQLGGHKAAAIALVLQEADIYLVSEMPPEFVRSIFLKPFSTVQSALDAARGALGRDASVMVMPYGGSTLPVPAR